MEKTRFSTSKTARGVIYYQPDFDQTERKGEDRMPAIGFDNQKYLTTQSEQIKKRIAQFGGKLYLEFGGKLFDDYHASRVLPGFEPDSKIRMLQQLQDDVEILIADRKSTRLNSSH